MAGLADTVKALAREGVISDVQASAVLERATSAFGKYRLEAKLGEGGMGEVWKAWESGLGRWVALKFIKGDHPEDVARFIREAQVAAKLTHPAIVAVHEAGEMEGKQFIAMDFVEGDDLKKLRVNERRAVELIRDAAEAVHYAHERGVVHRDLKPANLMVTKDGRLLVMDFGLAKSAGAGISQSGTIVGTPAYMGPEQARGEKVDARADVYALGATLYDLVTGRPPFEGENVMAVLNKVENEEPMPPTCSADLRTIIAKCMEKDASRRYASAKELADDLGRELAGDPISARPASAMYRLKKRIKKRPMQWALGALLVAAIGVGAGLAIAAEVKQRGEADRRSIIESSMIAIMEAEDELADPTIELGEIQEKLKGAIGRLEAGVRRFDDSKMMFWLGRACDLMGQEEDALAWFGRVIGPGPGDPRAHYYRARIRLRQSFEAFYREEGSGREDQVRFAKLAREDVEIAGRGVTAGSESELLKLYSSYINFADPVEIGKACEARLQKGGRTEEFYYFAAQIAHEQNRPRDALLLLDASIQNHPRQFHALFSRSIVRGALGDSRGEIEDCTAAIQLRPDSAKAYHNRAVARGQTGDEEGAIDDCTRAIALEPEFVEPYVTRGAMRWELGDMRGAADDAGRAVALRPERPDGYLNRGFARCGLGDFKGAIEDCEQALRLAAPDWEHRGNAVELMDEARRKAEDDF